MGDATRRDLERRWRETGARDDGVRFLRERVRGGDLSQERLELAAYCGDEVAGALSTRAPPGPAADAWSWAEGLVLEAPGRINAGAKATPRHVVEHTRTWASAPFARDTCVRACLAAAQLVVEVAASSAADAAVAAAQRWLDADRAAATLEAARAADELQALLDELRHEPDGLEPLPSPRADALEACMLAAEAVVFGGGDFKAPARAVEAAARALGDERAVVGHVSEALRRWALR